MPALTVGTMTGIFRNVDVRVFAVKRGERFPEPKQLEKQPTVRTTEDAND